jgi:hypothetical protein
VERTDRQGKPIAAPHKVRVVNEPRIAVCTGCGNSFVDDLGFCPRCGRYTSNQADQGSYPETDRYIQQFQGPQRKSARLATMLAAALGLMGIMGIGHLYMRKYVKGFVLLLTGGFFALLSLASIILVFTPDEFPVGVKIITAVILSVPILAIYIWQLLDAPKPARSGTDQQYYRYNKPPSRP